MTGVLLACALFALAAAITETVLHLVGDQPSTEATPGCSPLSHPPRTHSPRRNRP